MPRSRAALAAILLALAACSSDGSTPGSDGAGSVPTAGSSPGMLQQVAVIGSGRAVQAASATGAATVIGTTIGVNATGADGVATPVPTGVDVPASDVTVSPDGRYAAVEGFSRTEVWSLETSPTLVAAFDSPTRATFSADSATLMASSGSQVALSPVAGAPQPVITAPDGGQLGAATMTSDGGLVAVPLTGGAGDIVTYSAAAGAVVTDVFAEPERQIVRAAFGGTPDRLILEVSAADPFEGQLAAWDPGAGQLAWETGAGFFSPGMPWDVGADGRVLTADESTLRLIGLDGIVAAEWPLGDGRTVTAIVATARGYALALSDSTLLLTGADGNPGGPSVPIGRRIVDLERLAGADGAVTVDADGTTRAFGADGALLNENSSYRAGAVNDVAVSNDETSVAFASTDGIVTIADPTAARPPLTLAHPEGNVDSVAISPDGAQVVSGVGQRLSDVAFDDTVSLWNVSDGARTAAFGGEGEDVNGCANFRNTVRYSPDGQLIASASHDFTVQLHRADTGELIATLPPHVSSVLDLAFSPTGDRLVSTSDDGAVRVWDVAATQLLTEFVGPPGGYWSVAFTPDGTSLVVSDLTGTLHRIDAATGSELTTFEGTTSRTGRPAVSPDGTLVAAAADGNAVGLWSVVSGALLSQSPGHLAPVTSAQFTSSGDRLVTGSADTTVRVWSVTPA